MLHVKAISLGLVFAILAAIAHRAVITYQARKKLGISGDIGFDINYLLSLEFLWPSILAFALGMWLVYRR